MRITGYNLQLVRDSLVYSIGLMQERIKVCNGSIKHAKALEAFTTERQELEWMLAKVNKAILREAKCSNTP